MIDRGTVELCEVIAITSTYAAADPVEQIDRRNEVARRLKWLAEWMYQDGWMPALLIELSTPWGNHGEEDNQASR